MTRNELLFQLRSLEIRLLDPKVDEFVKKQDEITRARFVALTFDLRIIIMKLTTAQLSDIAARLDDLSDEIESGISNLQGTIDKLKNVVEVINAISTVVGFAARIVGLVL